VKNFLIFLLALGIWIAVCSFSLMFVVIKTNDSKTKTVEAPHKVKVVWYQVNEYPMTIDGVMDGENVRIN
jgi:hypothetical protein